jgi:hypothetical protein
MRDRRKVGPDGIQKRHKLGGVGERLALEELANFGFTAIRHLNHPVKNFRFADIYAELGDGRFWISVKTRNKYEIDRWGPNGEPKLNGSYKITKDQRAWAKELEDKYPGTTAACIGISIVVSQECALDNEPANSYSCYFSQLSALKGRHGMNMRKRATQNYLPLAVNKVIPPEFDVSDCENIDSD